MKVVLNIGAIIAQLVHLASHVWAVIQSYFVGATVLQEEQHLKLENALVIVNIRSIHE